MDDELRRLRAQVQEKDAVIRRVKEHVSVWLDDKRMRLSAQILLAHIERIEAEERAKSV